MSYIGRGIDQIDNISTLDNLSFSGSTATFNLTQNSVAFVPVSADALQIQIDGVIQSGNYTVSGSTVTFDFTPSGSSVCNGIRHYGVGLLTTVSDGAVTSAKLGNNSVGITQLNVSDGSNGQALTTNGSGTLAFADAGLSGWSSSSGNLLPSDASKGIYLGVNSATASNLLDEYEEGVWTPTFYDAESGGAQLSTSSAAGNYVKVGNLIRINSRSTISSISGANGGNAVRMRGLPYAIFNQVGNDAIGKAEIWNTGASIDSELTALPRDAGAVAMFKYRASASTSRPSSLTVDNLSTGTVISSLTYRTA